MFDEVRRLNKTLSEMREQLAQIAKVMGLDLWSLDTSATSSHMLSDLKRVAGEVAKLRERVEVTDDDIRAAGLGDPDICEECPRFDAWVDAQPELWRITRANADSPCGCYSLNWGIWSCVGEELDYASAEEVFRGSVMAHDSIINAVAKAVGRAPLDVLDEIAATEVGS